MNNRIMIMACAASVFAFACGSNSNGGGSGGDGSTSDGSTTATTSSFGATTTGATTSTSVSSSVTTGSTVSSSTVGSSTSVSSSASSGSGGAGSCSTLAEDACYDCCDTTFPDGAETYWMAELQACACSTGSPCATACGDAGDYCQAPDGNGTTACDDCLDGLSDDDPCWTAADSACTDADCVTYNNCQDDCP